MLFRYTQMKKFLLLIAFITTFQASAQDSLIVLHYNLLNFGNYTSYCNNSNNNHLTKEGYLKTILKYSRPDIFTVNEISRISSYHDRILNNVLNSTVEGKWYKRAASTNIAGSDLLNMIYYDTTKLALKASRVLQSYVRDVNLYTLYYKSIPTTGDTIFINCIVAHLKAGSDVSDEISRATMADNIISRLENSELPGNYLLMGDFNLYTAQEDAYQILTRGSVMFPFYDPVMAEGSWNNNSQFSHVHTQSVSSTGNGCQSGGGMDDRFDFILASSQIMNGHEGLRYKQGSYKAIGQDGKHFNQSITNLPNNSVPTDILNALGKNSDHLPVQLVLEVQTEAPGAIDDRQFIHEAYLRLISDDEAQITLSSSINSLIDISLFNLAGQLVYNSSCTIIPGTNQITIPLHKSRAGFYLLNIRGYKGETITLKLIK